MLTKCSPPPQEVLNKFGFMNYDIMLSTRPAESIGDDAVWVRATEREREREREEGMEGGIERERERERKG